MEPAAIPTLSLASVTSDQALYREGRDEIHLLVLDPPRPATRVAASDPAARPCQGGAEPGFHRAV